MKKGDRVFVIFRNASTDPVKEGRVTIDASLLYVHVRIDGMHCDKPEGLRLDKADVWPTRLEALMILAATVDGEWLAADEQRKKLKRERARLWGLVDAERELVES